MGKIWLGHANGCWLDVWEAPDCRGTARRLYGPVDLPHLRIGDGGSEPLVRSLIVGPNAYVQCFEELDFYDSVFWLLPNQRVDDVADLACGDEIDSIRLWDRPPFAHEPGYAAYMLWAASHITRTSQGGISQTGAGGGGAAPPDL